MTSNDVSFSVCSSKCVCDIVYDKSDFEVVAKSAKLLANDIELVTNNKPQLLNDTKARSKQIILVGTIGHNRQIDLLIKSGKIDVSEIRNCWERFIIKTINHPFPNIEKALVIVGSDRRGTAYGIFTLSESIGVSPWYWWADVPVVKKTILQIAPLQYISKSPSVKYRGIFLNDEGWGLLPWASLTDDPNRNNIGPKTYAKIFELLLRLKANMLAPAMHSCSAAFNTVPENKLVADSFGIIMSSSHCEPLLFNNASEWDTKSMGEWNYLKNKEGINKVLSKRISENALYENIYTLGLRGIHDGKMIGVPEEKEIGVLESVFSDQRSILKKYISQTIDSIPQIFVPYKEVLDVYERGLKLPDNITLVWPDDNYGYIKRLSNKAEQTRSGHSGVYYHISYLGGPHDYLWLNTTPPALIFEEMNKAFDTGADRYWLLNVGDIKPGELGVQLFMEMAWDINKFNYSNISIYYAQWLSSIFGNQFRTDIADILKTYYKLGFQRKPEAMGGGFEWTYGDKFKEPLINTDFSMINYNEADHRINEYNRIALKATQILNTLPEKAKPSFFELVYYPVMGASLMNKKMLITQKNHWYATQSRTSTNQLAQEVKACFDSIELITKQYNALLNGKWNNMMSLSPGWAASYQDLPVTQTIKLPEKAEMMLFLPGEDCTKGVRNIHTLPCINPFTRKDYFVEIYNKGSQTIAWKASTNDSWIKLSKTEGCTLTQERITVSVDWDKAPIGECITGEVEFKYLNNKEKVFVSLFNPASPTVMELKDFYVEDNGCISINPADFQRKSENVDVKIQVIDGLGYENQCVQLGQAIKPEQSTWGLEGPRIEYDFYTFSSGSAKIYIYTLPLFSVDKSHGTSYGIVVDNDMMHRPSVATKENSDAWLENVIRNCKVNITSINIDKPGKHILRVLCADPGVIIQKIVIDMGGLKKSYLGPEITKVQLHL